MTLKLEDKKAIVKELSGVVAESMSAAAADYRGLSVGEMDVLRKNARNSNVYLRVVRNTLAKKAVKGTDFECMQDSMTGPLILAFAQEEPGAAARLFRDFSKDHDKLEVKFLAMGGQVLGADQLKRVASMPTRDQALGQLAGLLQAPIVQLARTIKEPQSKLVRTLAAYRDKLSD